MSAKLKITLVLLLSVFATTVTGLFLAHRQSSPPVSATKTEPKLPSSRKIATREVVVNSERLKYKSIPLDSIQSVLQGTDPAALALNAFYPVESKVGKRKVEVVYPQPNQALVTITAQGDNYTSKSAVKYRVEMTSLGRSLFVNSPPLWQIVWAGYQNQCHQNGKPLLTQSCQ